ncbi:hypothetical protein EXU85_23335 [Spirosoma sp. KCTC 42546]|uniref:hypothetical protein n=1 Tax=Spirosoma sp. KCTC 42546 TaxID=2520506 RepID=UPI0011582756|nr:hypothetical protein [Spirosoma sp. KCTC 42546]QDK81382.1 hypothetical protein EXU85_23335 [Spirosoma sp. KCTC 42546]
MATSYAVRSFRNALFTLLAIGLLTASCKKSGGADAVDPRDQYVGTYTGGFQTSFTVGGVESAPESGTATIVISKGSNPREFYIDATMPRPQALKVTAQLDESGKTFTVIDRNQDQMSVLNKTFTGDFTATGVFENNQIAISTTTETVQGGRISRYESISGTKK